MTEIKEVKEYKVEVLEYADKQTMMKEQYKRIYQQGEESDIMRECDEIEIKLCDRKQWVDYKCKCNNGYKNRKGK